MVRNLWHAFVQTVGRHPKRAAIIKGDAVVTFAEWLDRAGDYHTWFVEIGGRPSDRVILWMENSAEMAAALFGLWATGGIPVLLHAEAPASHLVHAIDVTAPRALLHAPEQQLPSDELFVRVCSTDEVGKRAEPVSVGDGPWLTEPASIAFTSGSTGKPKGVTQSHGNLIVGCETVGAYLGYRDDDRLLCPIPWSFDYGFGQLLSTGLLGLTCILPTKPNPFALCEAITRHRPTIFPGLPSWFTYLLRGVSPFADTDISSLRMVTNTGGTIPRPVFEDMLQAFEHCEIVLNYGLTESYRSTYLHPSLVRDKPGSIGKPMPGVDIVVVRDDGSVAEAGEIGELVHRGNCVFMGYWGDPEATARSLRQDPVAPEGCPEVRRALFTGDLGWRDEHGFLFFKGRADHQLKSMGVRVSPGEIEDLLFQSGLVVEVAVFGVSNDLIGDEVFAAVVPAPGTEGVARALDRHARKVMSPHMMPRKYLVKTELPKTHSGKTDYVALKSEGLQQAFATLSGR